MSRQHRGIPSCRNYGELRDPCQLFDHGLGRTGWHSSRGEGVDTSARFCFSMGLHHRIRPPDRWLRSTALLPRPMAGACRAREFCCAVASQVPTLSNSCAHARARADLRAADRPHLLAPNLPGGSRTSRLDRAQYALASGPAPVRLCAWHEGACGICLMGHPVPRKRFWCLLLHHRCACTALTVPAQPCRRHHSPPLSLECLSQA